MLGGMLGVFFAELGLPLPRRGAGGDRRHGRDRRRLRAPRRAAHRRRRPAAHHHGHDRRRRGPATARPAPLRARRTRLAPFTAGPSLKLLGAAIERQTVWIWALTALAVVALPCSTARRCSAAPCAPPRSAATPRASSGVNASCHGDRASFALAAALGAVGGLAVAPLTQTAFRVGAGHGRQGLRRGDPRRPRQPRGRRRRRPDPRPAREPHRRVHRPAATRTPWPSSSCSSCSSCGRRASSAARAGRRSDERPHRSAPSPRWSSRSSSPCCRCSSPTASCSRSSPSPASTPWWSIGLALLFGHAGQVSLGHAAFVGIGAYTCAVLHGRARVAVAARLRRAGRGGRRSAGSSSPCPACASRATTWRWRRSASAS